MNRKISAVLFLLVLVLIPIRSIGQADNSAKIKKVAREIMENSKTCALISTDENGFPAARAMDAFKPTADFTIWMGTHHKTRKVKQIKNKPMVSVYYLADESSGYVLLKGKAELVNDKASKEKWWKEGWEQFYTDKEKEFLLIKITPVTLEVVSYPHNLLGDHISWHPPLVDFK